TTFAGALTAALVLVALIHVPVVAQNGTPAYSGPRTPWGDPDLQGNYTNLWEAGTPFERPDQFAGRTLEDIKGDELAAIRRAIQERTRTEQLAGDIGGQRWIWLHHHHHPQGTM